MNRTSSFLLAAATFAAGTVALPALAATPDPAATVAASATPPASARRYCIVETRTGSLIARKTCQTREAWMREGFDPLAKT